MTTKRVASSLVLSIVLSSGPSLALAQTGAEGAGNRNDCAKGGVHAGAEKHLRERAVDLLATRRRTSDDPRLQPRPASNAHPSLRE